MFIKNIEININTDKLREDIEYDVQAYYKRISKMPAVIVFYIILFLIIDIILTSIIRRAGDFGIVNIAGSLILIDVAGLVLLYVVLQSMTKRNPDMRVCDVLDTNTFLQLISFVKADNVYNSITIWLSHCPGIEYLSNNFSLGYMLVHNGNWNCKLEVNNNAKKVKVRCVEEGTKEEVTLKLDRVILSDDMTAERADDLVLCFTEEDIILYDKKFFNSANIVKEFKV